MPAGEGRGRDAAGAVLREVDRGAVRGVDAGGVDGHRVAVAVGLRDQAGGGVEVQHLLGLGGQDEARGVVDVAGEVVEACRRSLYITLLSPSTSSVEVVPVPGRAVKAAVPSQ